MSVRLKRLIRSREPENPLAWGTAAVYPDFATAESRLREKFENGDDPEMMDPAYDPNFWVIEVWDGDVMESEWRMLPDFEVVSCETYDIMCHEEAEDAES